MHRKEFLAKLIRSGLAGFGLVGLGPGAFRPIRAWAEDGTAEGGGLDPLGVQLYTVRDHMAQDVAATLRVVADIGYREVETAGLFDLSPERFRDALETAGLVSPAAHVGIALIRQDPVATLDSARTLGQRWVVVPSLSQGERSADGYRRVAEDLNRFGAAAREHGIRAAYHNHDFEFAPVDGDRTGYDLLLAETDPELVDMELDLFWAVRGGCDPVALFNSHPGRFPLCHVKDMLDISGTQEMVSVGEGDIDFTRIFAHAERAGLRHYFVEHDAPTDSLESIRIGFDHLQRLSSGRGD